jgi:hypothetical protein
MPRVQGSTTFRAALVLAVAFVATAMPVLARADRGSAEEAREAYDRGTAAHARGDYRAAANELARADALAPNTVALKAALDEALLADDPELGMQLVERARVRAPGDATLAPSVRDATTRFAGRTGRVRIDCGGRTCRASIDARPMDLVAPAIVLVGPHRVVIDADGAVTTKDIAVAGDREVDVVLPAPAPRPPPTPPASTPPAPPPPPSHPPSTGGSKGLSPVWFLTAAAVTAVAGGFTIASGVDTANRHSSFVAQGCGSEGGADCGTLASSGNNAQTRTNILATTTGVLGVTTIALALFVQWRHVPAAGAERVSLILGDRSAALRVRF